MSTLLRLSDLSKLPRSRGKSGFMTRLATDGRASIAVKFYWHKKRYDDVNVNPRRIIAICLFLCLPGRGRALAEFRMGT